MQADWGEMPTEEAMFSDVRTSLMSTTPGSSGIQRLYQFYRRIFRPRGNSLDRLTYLEPHGHSSEERSPGGMGAPLSDGSLRLFGVQLAGRLTTS